MREAYKGRSPFPEDEMQPTVTRTTLISGAALGAALVWGAVEFVALQWNRFLERHRRAS